MKIKDLLILACGYFAIGLLWALVLTILKNQSPDTYEIIKDAFNRFFGGGT